MCSLVLYIVPSSFLHFQCALQLLGCYFCIRKYFRMYRQTFTLTSSNEAWLINTMGIEVKEMWFTLAIRGLRITHYSIDPMIL